MPRPPRLLNPFSVTALEDRTVPAPLVGLLNDGTTLVTLDSDAPAAILTTKTVSGLDGGATLVGIDFRESNSKLYGVSSNSRLYTLDPATGAAAAVGAPFATPLSGSVFGVDFNPAVDKLRIVSNTNQNLAVTIAGDGTLTVASQAAQQYDPARFNAAVADGAPPAPVLAATAYTSNPAATGTARVATQYVIDSGLSLLSTQGGPEGTPNPSTGTLFAVDKLDFTPAVPVAFDIQRDTDLAVVATGSKAYVVNLATAGTLKSLDLPAGTSLRDLSFAPPTVGAGNGTVAFAVTAATFPATRGPLTLTVTRTGGTEGTATVNFATGGGDAVANVDYLPSTGTLTFGPGVTTQQVVVQLPAGVPVPTPARTVQVTLSGPGGGAALGANAVATLTIPAVTADVALARGRFFAVGAGVGGGPRVTVFDAASAAQVGNFFAYEPTFTGGVTVATADVNGDGYDDVIVGSGLGGGPRVRIFSGATLTAANPTVLADFFAYEDSFRGGVNVAVGDVTGDGVPEIAVGSGVGGGPRIRLFDAAAAIAAFGKASPASTADFFAYEDTFRGGVTVALGELTGDNRADIVAGSGVGGGPRVRLFDATAIGTSGTPAAKADFFAYDPSFRNGVNVGTGVVIPGTPASGTTAAVPAVRSILTGSGEGGGPQVGVFSAAGKSQGAFFAYDQTLRGGVRVASADFLGNGVDEILTGNGPGAPVRVRLLSATGAEVAAVQPYESTYLGGVFVG